MNQQDMNPTGIEVRLDQLIPMTDFAPSHEQSQAILAVIENIPKCLFWLEGRWEDEAGNIIELAQIDRWVYLH
jgi:hypothetical protein